MLAGYYMSRIVVSPIVVGGGGGGGEKKREDLRFLLWSETQDC